MPNDVVTQSRYVHGLFLGNEMSATAARALRREANLARVMKDARPIREVFGHGLITIGEKLAGHPHPESRVERAA